MLLGRRNESDAQALGISPLTSSSKSQSGVSPESKQSRSEYHGPPTIDESVAEDSLDSGDGLMINAEDKITASLNSSDSDVVVAEAMKQVKEDSLDSDFSSEEVLYAC
jgi:hypothetical protein